MKRLIAPFTGAAFAAVSIAAPVAQAETRSDVYVGVAGGGYRVEDDSTVDNDRSQFLRAFAGVKLSETLSLEGDYTRVLESEKDAFESPIDFEGDAWSLYLRPAFQISPNVSLYGKAGWAWFDDTFAKGFEAPVGTPPEETVSDDRFSWGGGVDLNITESMSVRGDYTRVDIDRTADVELFSVGFSFMF